MKHCEQTKETPSAKASQRRLARSRPVAVGLFLTALLATPVLVAPTAFAAPILPVLAPGLPDGRAYELLTPTDKEGAEDLFGSGERSYDVGVSSADGNEFLLDTAAAFGPFPAARQNVYVFSRGENSWTYTAVASPTLGVQSIGNVVYDPSDFSRLGLLDAAGSSAGGGAVQAIDLLGPPGGPYATIGSGLLESAEEATPVGGSSDLSNLLLQSRDHQLAPGDAAQDPESEALYDWTGGELHLINVDSKGALLSPCGAVLGLGASANPGAVSADGTRIFFTAPDPSATGTGCWNGATANPPQLYMRVGGATTVDLSSPEAGVSDPNGLQAAAFVGASSDGSRVFFMTETELTHDDEGIHDPELYSYDTETHALTRVSRGESGHAEADVYNVPAISADGRAVYFTAFGQLTSDAPALSGEEVNLYRYDTETEATAYLATVNQRDYADTSTGRWWPFPHGEEIGLDPAANWETIPDGRYLLFATTHDVSTYNSTAAASADCPDATGTAPPNGHCDEVYRYDSAAGPGEQITCVSCNPSGADPTSNALFARSAFSTDNPAATPPQAISDDGSYVFFDTADALIPTDVNERLDVYEWHEGAVSLISSGRDSYDSFFLDSSPDGSNVFFGTHAGLVPQDADRSGDLYDARIGGGIGGSSGAAPCEGDACQSPPPPPDHPTPATETSPGPGNLTPIFPKQPHRKRHHHKQKHRKRAYGTRHPDNNRWAGK